MGDLQRALHVYGVATTYVKESGFYRELAWQSSMQFHEFSEQTLLRESAWVILCSGFREEIVRKRFDYLSLCFCEWESATSILESMPACRFAALGGFGNSRKIDAIISVAEVIACNGFESLKARIIEDPVRHLQELPFVGPTTSWHLAKNLGYNVAKPDRHLVRLSNALRFEDAHALCSAIAAETGENSSTVDIVLWRFLVSQRRARPMKPPHTPSNSGVPDKSGSSS
jgi:hypothetical protein